MSNGQKQQRQRSSRATSPALVALTVVWRDDDDVAVLGQLPAVVEAQLVSVPKNVAASKDPELQWSMTSAGMERSYVDYRHTVGSP